MITTIYLAALLVLPGAEASPLEPYRAALTVCVDLPQAIREGAGVTAVDDLGEDGGSDAIHKALHIRAGEQRWVVFTRQDKTCYVYPVARDAKRTGLKFWPGQAGKVDVITLKKAGKGSWYPAVLVEETSRDGQPRVLDAMTLSQSGDVTKLSTLRLFDDAATLRVDLADAWGSGGDVSFAVDLVHVFEGRLASVFTTPLGTRRESQPVEDIKKRKHCSYTEKGDIKVAKKGATPTLAHLQTRPGEPIRGGKLWGTRQLFKWDATEKYFKRGAAKPRKWRPSVRCRPLRKGDIPE